LATDFSSSKKTVNRDLTSVVYKNYIQGEWGVEAGYNTVPDWYAYMRRNQLEWLEEQDCADSLNYVANTQSYTVTTNNWSCPYPFQSVKYDTSAPNGVCYCQKPVGFPPVYEITLNVPVNTPTYTQVPLKVLVTAPIPGCNPFPSIHRKDKCKIAKIPLCPTAIVFEFGSCGGRYSNNC